MATSTCQQRCLLWPRLTRIPRGDGCTPGVKNLSRVAQRPSFGELTEPSRTLAKDCAPTPSVGGDGDDGDGGGGGDGGDSGGGGFGSK